MVEQLCDNDSSELGKQSEHQQVGEFDSWSQQVLKINIKRIVIITKKLMIEFVLDESSMIFLLEKIAPSFLFLQQKPHKEQRTKIVKKMNIGMKISIDLLLFETNVKISLLFVVFGSLLDWNRFALITGYSSLNFFDSLRHTQVSTLKEFNFFGCEKCKKSDEPQARGAKLWKLESRKLREPKIH